MKHILFIYSYGWTVHRKEPIAMAGPPSFSWLSGHAETFFYCLHQSEQSPSHDWAVCTYVCMYAERCISSSQDERVQREGIWAHYGALHSHQGRGPSWRHALFRSHPPAKGDPRFRWARDNCEGFSYLRYSQEYVRIMYVCMYACMFVCIYVCTH